MKRTQIYLTDDEDRALTDRAKKTGRSKSDLIREAIDVTYLSAATNTKDLLKVLERTAGAWKGRRATGSEYVDKLRAGRLKHLYKSP